MVRTSATEVGPEAEVAAENRQLREALASRATIDQAKGMLMLRYGMDADQAFALLSRWSQERNIKVRTLAEAMVQAASAASPRDPSGALDPETLWSRLKGS